jgi:predicted metal-dependent enzyme (double-stranded beta helix superfamily)
MFQKDRFVEGFKAAVADGQKAIRGLVRQAVTDLSGVLAGLGEPNQAGVYPLYHAYNLTVIHFVLATYMTLLPHNHHIFSVIGIYGGREDNVFWRRISEKTLAPH